MSDIVKLISPVDGAVVDTATLGIDAAIDG
jgi:hypothetical protein